MSIPTDRKNLKLRTALKKVERYKYFLHLYKYMSYEYLTNQGLVMDEVSAICFYWQSRVEEAIKEFKALNSGTYYNGLERVLHRA